MVNDDLKEKRRRMFDEMEQKLKETYSEEERMFYYHPSEERVVLTHALFWVMSQTLRGEIRLAAMAVVAGVYGGSMPEVMANEILDDMVFVGNRVKCRKVEGMMSRLQELVEKEMKR